METPLSREMNADCLALLARIVNGETAALASLYDRTASRLYALALRICSDRSAAEEIVSDVYMQVWRQASRYDPLRGRVMAWMLVMCRSKALDWLRGADPAMLHPDPALLVQDALSDDSDPLDVLLTLERDSAVAQAIAMLDTRDRMLLTLAFFRGLTHQEIATQCDMPLGTVKTALRRAMQTMRPGLEQARTAMRENP